MSNLLSRLMGRNATTPQISAASPREDFAKAVSVLRQATGKPETRAIPCRCAVSENGFTIIFERLSLAHRFQIARIEKIDAVRSAVNGSIFRRGEQCRHSFDAGEFDWSGYLCPHCGNHAGTVHCGQCGETVCAGRVRTMPDGSKTFACHDACGATGKTERSNLVHGGMTETRPGGDRPQLASGTAKAKAFPNGARKRLPSS